MKTIKTFLILGLFLLLYHSCKKEDKTPVLPPETQEGKHTFGCLIDNKVFINEGSYQDYGNLNIYNYPHEIIFNINMFNSKQNIHQFMGINIKKPIKVGLFYFNASECHASFINGIDYDPNACYYVTDTTQIVGTLEISKYDTIQKTLSGRFNFKAHKYYHTNSNGDTIMGNCDSIITVTQGRFDIHYY